MQHLLLIYQGAVWDAIGSTSDEEKEGIGAGDGAVKASPDVTPGLSLGWPHDAATVRVEDGAPALGNRRYVNGEGAMGGYMLVEADNLDEAIDVASRPSVRGSPCLGRATCERPGDTGRPTLSLTDRGRQHR